MSTITVAMPPAFTPNTFDCTEEGFDSRQFPYQVTWKQVTDVIVPNFALDADGQFIEILGEDIQVINPYFIIEDDVHPMYFEMTGATHHYIVAIWADRIEIDTCRLETFEVLATVFPKTNSILRYTLAIMVGDYQMKEDLV